VGVIRTIFSTKDASKYFDDVLELEAAVERDAAAAGAYCTE
jgi:hypothetical protein